MQISGHITLQSETSTTRAKLKVNVCLAMNMSCYLAYRLCCKGRVDTSDYGEAKDQHRPCETHDYKEELSIPVSWRKNTFITETINL